MKNLILGAGVSGLGASYSLREKGEDSIILEKNNDFGGLCGNFQINGFLFDKFVHLSFTKDEKVLEIFNDSTREVLEHIPNPFNLYKRQWIKHPAQNNLYPLEGWEKNKIIQDFLNRPSVNMDTISDYEQWLRVQFGDYFAENFPMVYTKKYWMHEAKDLEIK